MKNESYKTQEERLRYLIRAMQKEMPQYRGIVIPEDSAGQKQLIRSLMNVRPPMPADPEFLAEQDLYLSEENAARGILEGADLAPVKENGRICLWQGDITRLKTGAIVNAANSALLGCFRPCHSCIDNIIHSYAAFSSASPVMRLWKPRGTRNRWGMRNLHQPSIFRVIRFCIRSVRSLPARCEEQTAGFWRTVTVPVWNWLWKIRLPRLYFAVSRQVYSVSRRSGRRRSRWRRLLVF